MRFGIGVDCEKTSFFKDVSSKKEFLKKVFTKKEIEYCKSKPNPPQHFAARFAGKEAIIKAFNDFDRGVFFNEIEILNNKKGAPFVNLLKGKLNKRFNSKISLSHSGNYAVAFAVVIDNKNGKNRYKKSVI